MKKCNYCHVIKNLNEFPLKKDGTYSGNCILCKNKRKDKSFQKKDIISKKKKEYYEKNKDQILIDRKEYYEDNKEIILDRNKKNYEKINFCYRCNCVFVVRTGGSFCCVRFIFYFLIWRKTII